MIVVLEQCVFKGWFQALLSVNYTKKPVMFLADATRPHKQMSVI